MSSTADDFKGLLGHIAGGAPLTLDQARAAFEVIMSGDATPSQMGAFLMGLRVRGETIDELTGGTMVLREKALYIEAPAGAVCLAGTGGDNFGTLNISTAASIVLAGCGVPVAKHGNRAMSSKSGSSDVLTALGVDIDCDMALIERSMREAGIGFLMAPRHHGAMRHVAGTRVELGTRTIFNLLGVMSNPAGVKRQLIGVFDRRWLEPMAKTLKALGAEHVWILHGSDGMDELTTTGPTHVVELKDGVIRAFDVSPEDVGLRRGRIEDLKGGNADHNAAAIRRLLEGEPGPFRDIVIYTAGAATMIGGKAASHAEGVKAAEMAIDSGKALAALDNLVRITNSGAAG
ncbi:anthranilate phosphoribosyltransferase [Oceanibacterium hippocampi]|uniref:Anthranilate phosphoribosyltransferase n=1 Tax=Oceanibacterium hippocampi TaxID=745714 RepID=A0A1Y5T596_9PROT|nr:anthranilate phosphoribosyltransferase [Oceanibacterium hippocampi]SLN54286.1 Anthranilate phosphoribosyltransferase [Oceanibacterium hippocampi]